MLGQLNKEEQVQVVIRLKPTPPQQINNRSVYLSDEQEKTLVVETPNKKEYFVFDNIADGECSQQQIYEYIGQDAVRMSTDGYNCCIFAYGQTGTGKTYSILGNSQDLLSDLYAQSRGILPRLLSDLFSWCENKSDRFRVKCSYLEIYNEQIIDLLNPDLKSRQIREDFKKGVFVEGLSEENANNYEEAINVLLRGVKNRKTSSTAMNDESSRSHTIFTLYIESEIVKDDITKTRRSKINIVDLAGSERAKQTKVDGERLKEGCNINRSLHVLGNVINALVESAKKKKHIPFRDSKLTHFLKDSLCGNSVTKLLANIHPCKAYLGDTLSTLMFAKRAKILKMKVEVNENMTENFQELRKEIRKLREELAQARYIKNEEKNSEKNGDAEDSVTEVQNIERMIDVSLVDPSKCEQALQVFEENENNYKVLIEIYEQHLKNCASAGKVKKNLNINQEWKNLEKRNAAYCNLLKGMPAFSKIFRENLHLKSQKNAPEANVQALKDILGPSPKEQKQEPNMDNVLLVKLKADYENLIKEIENKFTKYVEELESAYEELESDNRAKEDKIKELKKRKELPPDLEDLANENQYLKLNILELEDEMSNYEERQRKLQTQVKQLRKEKQAIQEKYEEGSFDTIYPKLLQIKNNYERESKEYEQERNLMLNHIDLIKEKLIASVAENKQLNECVELLRMQNKGLRKKVNSLLRISDQMEISKDQNTYTTTFWTNEESNFSEELDIFTEKNRDSRQMHTEEEKMRGIDLSNQILKLHKSYNEQILKLREEIRNLERASRVHLHSENLEHSKRGETKDENIMSKQMCVQELMHTRSSRTLGKRKQIQIADEEKSGHKGSPLSAKQRKSGVEEEFIG